MLVVLHLTQCHTGTELYQRMAKLKSGVQRTCINITRALDQEKTSSGSQDTYFQPKEVVYAKIWDFDDVILCHITCHNGTGLSYSAILLDRGVRKTYDQVLHALDWAKRSSGSRDMKFDAKGDVKGTQGSQCYVSPSVTPLLNYTAEQQNLRQVFERHVSTSLVLWIKKKGAQEAEIRIFSQRSLYTLKYGILMMSYYVTLCVTPVPVCHIAQ